MLTTAVPRVKCAEHGCRQVRVPWLKERSAYTRSFEQRVIIELRTQTVRVAATKLGMGWGATAGIQVCAVAWGLRRHLWGVLNAILFGVTNARSESINALIQRAKRNACSYRSWERFRASVLFLCGGLDLSPESAFPHGTRQTQKIKEHVIEHATDATYFGKKVLQCIWKVYSQYRRKRDLARRSGYWP